MKLLFLLFLLLTARAAPQSPTPRPPGTKTLQIKDLEIFSIRHGVGAHTSFTLREPKTPPNTPTTSDTEVVCINDAHYGYQSIANMSVSVCGSGTLQAGESRTPDGTMLPMMTVAHNLTRPDYMFREHVPKTGEPAPGEIKESYFLGLGAELGIWWYSPMSLPAVKGAGSGGGRDGQGAWYKATVQIPWWHFESWTPSGDFTGVGERYIGPRELVVEGMDILSSTEGAQAVHGELWEMVEAREKEARAEGMALE